MAFLGWVSGDASAQVITLDGLIGDWGTTQPIGVDAGGDAGDDAVDLLAGFALLDGNELYLRLDVADLASATFPLTFTALIDDDSDAGTGCDVVTAAGTVSGVEHRIDATVSAGPQVTALSRSTCAGMAFGAPVAVNAPVAPPWSVGADLGEGGGDVVEFYVSLSGLAVSEVVGFTASNGSSDALLISPNVTAAQTDAFADTDTDGKAETGETVTYTVTVKNEGGGEATGVNLDETIGSGATLDAGSVNVSPLARDDRYEAVGNTLLVVGGMAPAGTAAVETAGSLFDNDTDFLGEGCCTLQTSDGTSTEGGTVSVSADGSFSYTPPAGFQGTDTFTYTLVDGGGLTGVGTATIVVSDMVWYVDNSKSAGDGRSSSPFNAIGDFNTVQSAGGANDPEAGDYVFIYTGDGMSTGYDAGITLKDGQKLIGQGVDLVVGAQTLVTASTKPKLATSGNAVTVTADTGGRTGIEVRGLDLESTSGDAVEVTASGTNAVGVTIRDNHVTGAGANGIDLNPGSSADFDVTVQDNTFATASTTANGIDLTTTAGTGSVFAAISGNTDVTSSGGTGINVDGSAGGTLILTGLSGNTVHGNNAGAGIVVNTAVFDADASDADFTGDQVDAGNTSVGSAANPVGGAAMKLMNVKGDLSFGTLDLYSDGGGTDAEGLKVSGNGTFDAGNGTGFKLSTTAGTIDAMDGPGLDVAGTTLGATFSSVSSAGSAGAGIALSTTTGTLTMTGGAIQTAAGAAFSVGSGTDASGGDATVSYGGTITNSAGRAVQIQELTGGSVTLSGDITDTGTGIRIASIDNGTAATVTLSAGTKTVNVDSGVNDAVSLGGNTDGTINFTGGGLDIDINTGGGGFIATGGGTVNVTGAGNSISSGGGAGVDMANTAIGTSGVTFASVSTSNASTGIRLDAVGSNAFTASGGTIANASSRGLDVNGGTGNVTVGASISTSATGRSVEVTGRTGGTVTVSGAVDDNGVGIGLVNNGGGTITFSGGLALDPAVNQTAFMATNGGTINVCADDACGAGPGVVLTNTINTTTGQAVVMSGVSLGSSDVTFSSITVSGSPTSTDALSFTNVSNAGSFIVTGTTTVNGTTTSGDGIDINGSSAPFSFNSVDIDATAGAGLQLTNNTGSVTVSGGTIGATTTTTGDAVNVSGGTGMVSIGAAITNSSNNAVDVRNRTTGGSGSVTFSGAIAETGTGVFLDDNDGSTLSFTGGLTINTGTNAGFTATNGGTVNVTGSSNTVTTTTATAVNIANTTIGGSGVAFMSVSATGASANPGIVLTNTGSNAAGFVVTGDGGGANNGSGGSIANRTGDGVTLTNAANVSLNYMNVDDNDGNGIMGTSVNGFTMNRSNLRRNGTQGDATEACLHFINLAGSMVAGTFPTTVTNSVIFGAGEDNVRIHNDTGTLSRFMVTGSTIGDAAAGNLNNDDGIDLEASGTAITNITVDQTSFVANRGDHFNTTALAGAAMDVVFTNNTLAGGHSSPLGQGVTIASGGGNASTTYNVSGNTINGAVIQAINVNKGDFSAGTMSGVIDDNTIGTPGVAGSGSSTGVGIQVILNGAGTHTSLVTNNKIREWENGPGIRVLARDHDANGSGTLNVTVSGNTLTNPGSFGYSMLLQAGATSGDTHTLCANVGDPSNAALKNAFVDNPSAFDGTVTLFQRFSTTMNLAAYAGGATSDTDLTTYFQNRNTGVVTVQTGDSPYFTGGINTGIGGGVCPKP